MKTRPDYIVCETESYETLKLYMVFYEFDEDYVELAKNDKWVLLRKKNPDRRAMKSNLTERAKEANNVHH